MQERESPGCCGVDNVIFATILDEIPSVGILTDEKLRIIAVNYNACCLLSQHSGALRGLPLGGLIRPISGRGLAAQLRHMQVAGEWIKFGGLIQVASGTQERISIRVRRLACQICGSVFFLFFIRVKRQGRDAAQGQAYNDLSLQVTVRRLLKNASDSVMVIDYRKRVICECNAAAERLFGYGRGELIGRSPEFLAISQDLARQHVAESHAQYAHQGFYQAKMSCLRKDGSHFTSLATNITMFDSKSRTRLIIAINRDITEHENRIGELRDIAERARALTKRLEESLQEMDTPIKRARLSDYGFSGASVKVAVLLCTGQTIKQMADNLGLTEPAVKNRISALYRGLGVANRAEFVMRVREKWLMLE